MSQVSTETVKPRLPAPKEGLLALGKATFGCQVPPGSCSSQPSFPLVALALHQLAHCYQPTQAVWVLTLGLLLSKAHEKLISFGEGTNKVVPTSLLSDLGQRTKPH